MRFPGYKIERLIAEGGMASVYLAVQQSLDRLVALKLLKRFDSPTQTVRFFNEGRIIASLCHRNIITIHDIGVIDERPYIAMEYLHGGDLKQRIAGGIQNDEALDLLETLAGCLDFVHRRGIIHRDIKPENILFREDGTPIITDFGIAKQYRLDSSLTLDGMALGSPHYLSPEQAGCKALDGRADLYSLGILFYEMLTGKKPYRGDSPIDIIVAQMTAPIPKLAPAQQIYQPLLERMLAKDPDDRFADARSLVNYVQAMRGSHTAGNPQTTISSVFHDLRESFSFKSAAEGSSFSKLMAKLKSAIERGLVAIEARFPTRTIASVPFKPWVLGSMVLAAVALAGVSINRIRYISPPQPVINEPTTSPASNSVAPGANYRPGDSIPVSESTSAPQHEPASLEPDIVEYLASADAALNDYRLMTPPENNAYHYYQRILDLKPNHPDALMGIEAIGNAYADLATAALKRNDHRKARLYVNRGLTVQPHNQRLLVLERRARTVRNARHAGHSAESQDPFAFGERLFGKLKSVFE